MLNVEYLQTLAESDAYDLLAALRGCDEDSVAGPAWEPHVWKIEVTFRVRHIVFSGFPGCGAGPLDDEAINRVATTRGNCHWFAHLYYAVRASQTHPIWAGKAKRLMEALRG